MHARPLRLGFSPCPNDTFLFDAWVNHRLRGPVPDVDVELADVEELNRRAVAGAVDVTKLSFHAYFHVADHYVMLPAGAALGRGVGPLVVTRTPLDRLTGPIATPGGLTTANLLLDLWRPEGVERRELRYDRIMPAVAAGDVEAGLIIHESRLERSRRERSVRRPARPGDRSDGSPPSHRPLRQRIQPRPRRRGTRGRRGAPCSGARARTRPARRRPADPRTAPDREAGAALDGLDPVRSSDP